MNTAKTPTLTYTCSILGSLLFYYQMRSHVDGDIQLLPQWSKPIAINFSTLRPPRIITSTLLAINTTFINVELFSISVLVELTWEKPADEMDILYEVWVGSRPLGVFEEPEESEEFGSILPLQVPILRAL